MTMHNGFSVRVVGGNEIAGNYVEMEHGKQYSISLRNNNYKPADVDVDIDGKRIGSFRINPNSNILLERGLTENGRLTFYRHDSEEGKQAQLGEVSDYNLGLIQAYFHLEAERPRPVLPVTPVQSPPFWFWNTGTTICYDQDDYSYTSTTNNRNIRMREAKTNYSASDATDFCDEGSSSRSLLSHNVTSAQTSTHESGGTGLSGHSNQAFYNVAQLWQYDPAFETTLSLRLIGKKKQVRVLQSQNHLSVPSPLH